MVASTWRSKKTIGTFQSQEHKSDHFALGVPLTGDAAIANQTALARQAANRRAEAGASVRRSTRCALHERLTQTYSIISNLGQLNSRMTPAPLSASALRLLELHRAEWAALNKARLRVGNRANYRIPLIIKVRSSLRNTNSDTAIGNATSTDMRTQHAVPAVCIATLGVRGSAESVRLIAAEKCSMHV